MAILWDRTPYLSEVMNPEVIPLDQAIDAYRAFDEGSPKKFIIDPHGSLNQISKGKEAQRVSKRELAHA